MEALIPTSVLKAFLRGLSLSAFALVAAALPLRANLDTLLSDFPGIAPAHAQDGGDASDAADDASDAADDAADDASDAADDASDAADDAADDAGDAADDAGDAADDASDSASDAADDAGDSASDAADDAGDAADDAADSASDAADDAAGGTASDGAGEEGSAAATGTEGGEDTTRSAPSPARVLAPVVRRGIAQLELSIAVARAADVDSRMKTDLAVAADKLTAARRAAEREDYIRADRLLAEVHVNVELARAKAEAARAEAELQHREQALGLSREPSAASSTSSK